MAYLFDSARWRAIADEWVRAIATASKDKSTRVGAIIFRPDKSVASVGFNGFPPSINDDKEILSNPDRRDEKLLYMVHAEANAIDHAIEPLHDYSIAVTHHPCSECAKRIASKGIKEVLYIYDMNPKWEEDIKKSKRILAEAGVRILQA